MVISMCVLRFLALNVMCLFLHIFCYGFVRFVVHVHGNEGESSGDYSLILGSGLACVFV